MVYSKWLSNVCNAMDLIILHCYVHFYLVTFQYNAFFLSSELGIM